MPKLTLDDCAFWGGAKLFTEPKPTSGLHRPSEGRFLAYAQSIFSSRQLTNNGPLVCQLESRLAALHGTTCCVTFCSGFMALLITIRTVALSGKREVVMPSATYRRMADIVQWAGLTPRFADIDERSMGVDAALYRRCLTDATALLLGVHPIVNMSDVTGLEELSRETGIPLIFDSVEAAYGTIAGKAIGSFARAEVFSMHASKFINGFEGGYVTTDDKDLAATIKRVEAFGFKSRDVITELGCNAKLNEVHAAMSLACLDEIEEQIAHNKSIFACYEKALEGLPLRLARYDASEERTWKNIVVRLLDGWDISRDELLGLLQAENILARPYYSPPLHGKDGVDVSLPATEAVTASSCVLPSGAHVSEADVAIIAAFLHFIYANKEAIKTCLAQGGAA